MIDCIQRFHKSRHEVVGFDRFWVRSWQITEKEIRVERIFSMMSSGACKVQLDYSNPGHCFIIRLYPTQNYENFHCRLLKRSSVRQEELQNVIMPHLKRTCY